MKKAHLLGDGGGLPDTFFFRDFWENTKQLDTLALHMLFCFVILAQQNHKKLE